ncbi:hypothetical protein [Phytohabitans rumicis]|uniref:Uncharacterized protein n=1 Tax=Phytohabitans rumicis TaxID=1076125 RepID=A0A6V8L8Y1_9ACTN|nr:hypothetical protein [Phytohabitans rumicis]GFJ93702.1 hypothetical protein Prum_073440 [Phytohabitans rumicis]
MGRSQWFGRMFAGVLVALVAALSLTAAGASASSPATQRGAALAVQDEPLGCAEERTATAIGATVTIRPCLTLTDPPPIGEVPWLAPGADLTFSTDPNQPLSLCRVTVYFQPHGGSYGFGQLQEQAFGCMNLVRLGAGTVTTMGTYSEPTSPVESITGWVTVEIAGFDGPVQVVTSHQYTFTGPF